MRHNPASGAIVIMLRQLKMHGMAQAVGELTEQGSPAFEGAIPIDPVPASQGGNGRTRGPIDGLSAQDSTLSSLS